MAISLASVYADLLSKSGYTGTPRGGMLAGLKALAENQRDQRKIPGTTCSGFIDFTVAGPSLGNINDVVSKLKPLTCSCQSQTTGCTALGYTCSCDSRSSCSCDTQGCSCNQVGNWTCTCNSDNGTTTCGCNGNCTCDYISPCSCQGYYCSCDTQSTSGGCGTDNITTYSSTYSCGCNSESGCTALGYSCSCNSQAASCPCNSLYS